MNTPFASSPEFDDLLTQFKAAGEAEGAATRELLAKMEARAPMNVLEAATQKMEDTHSAKMDLWDRMQSHRLQG